MFEKDYLHEAFQYTGGGLVLTALAARSLFYSGAAVRIMSANPCECMIPRWMSIEVHRVTATDC